METQAKNINGYNIDSLQSTVAAIKNKPQMAEFQFRVTNKWLSGAHNRSYIKGLYGAGEENTSRFEPFILDTDMPGVLHGHNSATSPGELALHALVSCMTTTMMMQGSARGLKVDSVESKVTGDINLLGTLGLDENVPKEFTKVNITFNIQGDLSEEEKQILLAMTKNSPIYNAIANPVPVQVDIDTV